MWLASSAEASSCYLSEQKGFRTEHDKFSWQAWQEMSHLKIVKDDLEQCWILAFDRKKGNLMETYGYTVR